LSFWAAWKLRPACACLSLALRMRRRADGERAREDGTGLFSSVGKVCLSVGRLLWSSKVGTFDLLWSSKVGYGRTRVSDRLAGHHRVTYQYHHTNRSKSSTFVTHFFSLFLWFLKRSGRLTCPYSWLLWSSSSSFPSRPPHPAPHPYVYIFHTLSLPPSLHFNRRRLQIARIPQPPHGKELEQRKPKYHQFNSDRSRG